MGLPWYPIHMFLDAFLIGKFRQLLVDHQAVTKATFEMYTRQVYKVVDFKRGNNEVSWDTVLCEIQSRQLLSSWVSYLVYTLSEWSMCELVQFCWLWFKFVFSWDFIFWSPAWKHRIFTNTLFWKHRIFTTLSFEASAWKHQILPALICLHFFETLP